MGKVVESQPTAGKKLSGTHSEKSVKIVKSFGSGKKKETSGKLKRKVESLGKPGQPFKKPKFESTTDPLSSNEPNQITSNIKQENQNEPLLKKPKLEPSTEPLPEEIEEDEELEEIYFQEDSVMQKSSVTLKQLEGSDDYVLSDKSEVDLFCSYESNGRYDQYTEFNFMFTIFDEIALEGLDGITLEAFWKRMKDCLKFPTVLDNFRDIIWKLICANEGIKFYKLPEPRGELIVFDIGVMTEDGLLQEISAPEIYPFGALPKDCKDSGSCATYSSRQDITEIVCQLSYLNAWYTYGNSLVMVADQKMRSHALSNGLSDPTKEIPNNNAYNMLERIGRSRSIGALSQGINSLSNVLNFDSRTAFYYKQNLIQNHLIMSQKIITKGVAINFSVKTGRLYHLTRFYQKRKTKLELMFENIVNFLKTQPEFRMRRDDLRRRFHVTKKNIVALSGPAFSKYVTTVVCPYRAIYPDRPESEFFYKSVPDKERTVSMMQLLDPYVNVSAANLHDADVEDPEEDDEKKDEEISNTIGKKSMNLDLYRDIYLTIFQHGIEGISVRDISDIYNVNFYTMRLVLKRMTERGSIVSKKLDHGKTKITAYIATCFLKTAAADIKYIPPTAENIKKERNSSTKNVLEKLKAKQQRAIEISKGECQVYTKEQFLLEQEQFFENNAILPKLYDIPDVVCTYLVEIYSALSEPFTFAIPYSTPNISRNVIRLNLEFFSYTMKDTIDINNIWKKFNKNLTDIHLEIKSNFDENYQSHRKMDQLSMVFIIKALFEDIQINKPDILALLDSTGFFANELQKADILKKTNEVPKEKSLRNAKADPLNYMGPYPVKIVLEQECGIETTIEISTPSYLEPIDLVSYIPEWANTERTLDRAKKIIQIVKNHKVLDEFYKIGNEISASEVKEGYNKKIDRKSLLRLVKNLVNDGFVKVMVVSLKKDDLVKSKRFISVPEETYLHPLIQSQIDQLKHKYFLNKPAVSKTADNETLDNSASDVFTPNAMESSHAGGASGDTGDNVGNQIKKKSPFGTTDVMESIDQLRQLKMELREEELTKLSRKDTYFARKYYGLQQKFVRISIMHEILFYLIYEQPQNMHSLSTDEVRDLFIGYQIFLQDEDIERLPPIYAKEISWKMFVPPLPTHFEWPCGWALICDIVLRLPLSVITKICNFTYASRELAEAINHPIRKFMLLGHHSDHIKTVIMHKRKYIFEVYDTIRLMAYCGLAQFGPTKMQQKDQVFVYLNRKASLLNTVSSLPGYHKVENKEYPRLFYVFNSYMDIQHYWSTLYDISQNTKLNSSNAVKGRTITIVTPQVQPELQAALAVRTAEEALQNDDGELPGDHRGAGGLDSSLWAHKTSNWICGSHHIPKNLPNVLQKDSLEPHQQPVSYNSLDKSDRLPRKVFITKKVMPTLPKQKRIILKSPHLQGLKPGQKLPKHLSHKNSRTVFVKGYTKKKPGERKLYYDHVDRQIMKRIQPTNHKGRSIHKWSNEEDKVLTLLKVAQTMLTKVDSFRSNLTYITIRDVFHIMVPSSAKTKTSRAIERRAALLFKRQNNLDKIEMNIPSLFKIEPLAQYFRPLVAMINDQREPLKLTQQQSANAFIFLMSYFYTHRAEIESVLQGARVGGTDHLSNSNIANTEKTIAPFEDVKQWGYEEPETEDAITIETLKGILISALCSRTIQKDVWWSHLVFSTYRNYPNIFLKKSVDQFLARQLISRRKFNRRSQMQFWLSTSYVYAQAATYSYLIVENTFKIFEKLMKEMISIKDKTEILMPERLGLGEVTTFWWANMDFKIRIPEHLIVLDPSVEDHSELFVELARRYQIKLKNEQELKQEKSRYSMSIGPYPDQVEIKTEPPDFEIIDITEDNNEQMTNDLTFKSGNTVNIADLRNWIEGCIDVDRSRSPSPERIINKDVPIDLSNTQNEEETTADTGTETLKGILTIEEIKQEMMIEPSPLIKRRRVPYVLDLIDLLSENFEEIETESDVFKQHFIPEFPVLEEFGIESRDVFEQHHLVKFLSDQLRIEEVWERLKSFHYLSPPTPLDQIHEFLLQNDGTPQDIELVADIIRIVASKDTFGIKATDIKAQFGQRTNALSLEFLLSILTRNGILLQTGVCSVVFVHHRFKSPWTLNGPVFTEQEKEYIENGKDSDKTEALESVDGNMGSKPTVDIKVYPWVQLDGVINEPILKIWLTNVLSHCVEYPMVQFRSLCEKYYMVKPVDLYALLEILQELGCIRILQFQYQCSDVFSSWELNKECEATFLDSFEHMFIEPSIICMSALGALFVNKTQT